MTPKIREKDIILAVYKDDDTCVAPRCRAKFDRHGMPYIVIHNRKIEINNDKFPRPVNIDWNGKYTLDIKEGLDQLRTVLRDLKNALGKERVD